MTFIFINSIILDFFLSFNIYKIIGYCVHNSCNSQWDRRYVWLKLCCMWEMSKESYKRGKSIHCVSFSWSKQWLTLQLLVTSKIFSIMFCTNISKLKLWVQFFSGSIQWLNNLWEPLFWVESSFEATYLKYNGKKIVKNTKSANRCQMIACMCVNCENCKTIFEYPLLIRLHFSHKILSINKILYYET